MVFSEVFRSYKRSSGYLLGRILNGLEEFRFYTGLKKKSRFSKSEPLDLNVQGEYLISTDKGVYLLQQNHIKRVFGFYTFGITALDDSIYLACTVLDHSFIIKGNRGAFLREGSLYDFDIIYQEPVYHHGARIHQIHADQKNHTIIIACTGGNAVKIIDCVTGEVKREIRPFSDSAGAIISRDHNHINSVSIYGDYLLFCCHDHGMLQGFFGVIHQNDLRGYAFKHRGVHDIFVLDRHLLFSDTFGDAVLGSGASVSGSLYYAGQPMDEQFFGVAPGYVVRGVAGTGPELVVGHSYNAKRADRFRGNGGLIHIVDHQVRSFAKTPFSQVYDILRADGLKFDGQDQEAVDDSIYELMETEVGPLVLNKQLKQHFAHDYLYH